VRPVAYSKNARQELKEIYRYYELRQKGLGASFKEELGSVIESIRRTPQAFGYDQLSDTRILAMRRFPYVIHYLEEPSRIVVIAISHHRRKPGYWLQPPNGHPHSP
jgi:toxin ParE1/3/4